MKIKPILKVVNEEQTLELSLKDLRFFPAIERAWKYF